MDFPQIFNFLVGSFLVLGVGALIRMAIQTATWRMDMSSRMESVELSVTAVAEHTATLVQLAEKLECVEEALATALELLQGILKNGDEAPPINETLAKRVKALETRLRKRDA